MTRLTQMISKCNEIFLKSTAMYQAWEGEETNSHSNLTAILPKALPESCSLAPGAAACGPSGDASGRHGPTLPKKYTGSGSYAVTAYHAKCKALCCRWTCPHA